MGPESGNVVTGPWAPNTRAARPMPGPELRRRLPHGPVLLVIEDRGALLRARLHFPGPDADLARQVSAVANDLRALFPDTPIDLRIA